MHLLKLATRRPTIAIFLLKHLVSNDLSSLQCIFVHFHAWVTTKTNTQRIRRIYESRYIVIKKKHPKSFKFLPMKWNFMKKGNTGLRYPFGISFFNLDMNWWLLLAEFKKSPKIQRNTRKSASIHCTQTLISPKRFKITLRYFDMQMERSRDLLRFS